MHQVRHQTLKCSAEEILANLCFVLAIPIAVVAFVVFDGFFFAREIFNKLA